MRTALALLLLAAPAWASPPATPDAKKPTVKVEPKPTPHKVEAPKPALLDKHAETRKADAAPSTLTLTPKKKPARRVLLADWAP